MGFLDFAALFAPGTVKNPFKVFRPARGPGARGGRPENFKGFLRCQGQGFFFPRRADFFFLSNAGGLID